MMHTPPSWPSRRTAMQILLGAAALSLYGPPATTASDPALPSPFRDGRTELDAFMRVQSRRDAGYTAYVNEGVLYGARPGEQSVPMLGYRGLLRFHTTPAGPDRFEVRCVEVGLFTDPVTDSAIATTYRNPITGRAVPVHHPLEETFSWTWTPDALRNDAPAPGVRRRIAWQRFDDHTWLHFDNLAGGRPGSGGAGAIVSMSASTAALDSHGPASIPGVVFVDSSVNPWPAWMHMDEVHGRLANHVVGHKLAALSEAPPPLIAHIKSTAPHVLEDVDAWH